jgi:hypothetical protein
MLRSWFLVGCIAYAGWGCSGKGALPKGTNDAAVGQEGGASSTDGGSSAYADASVAGDASAEAQTDAGPITMRPVSNARSGLAWASGAYNMHDDANRVAFESARGRLSDVVVVFATRDTWALLGNTWYLDAHAAFPGKLVITYPMLPDNEGDLASAATDAYDQHWRDIAQAVLDGNRGDSIIRLAWESTCQGALSARLMLWRLGKARGAMLETRCMPSPRISSSIGMAMLASRKAVRPFRLKTAIRVTTSSTSSVLTHTIGTHA